jgi:hypothetical protein
MIFFSIEFFKKADTSPLTYQQKFLDIICSKYSTYVLCFTDGSKNPQPLPAVPLVLMAFCQPIGTSNMYLR